MASAGIGSTFLTWVIGIIILFLATLLWKRNVSELPGPRGIPVLGNIFQYPKEQEWLQFTFWGKTYGHIFQIKLLSQPIVILNSRKAAMDLLEKRSAIYSDRPRTVMAGELVGWRKGVTLIHSCDRHKRYRKNLHRVLNPNANREFQSLQEETASTLLQNLQDDPSKFFDYIRQAVTTSIVMIAYGHQITSCDDPFVVLAQSVQEHFALAATPNTFAVDWFPVLKYLPEWWPFASFKGTARIWREELYNLRSMPIQMVKDQLESNTAKPSYASVMLSQGELSAEEEDEIAWSALSLYTGGADTSVAALLSFILALVLHPDVADKLRQEMDAVTGGRRLPTFGDRPALPYLHACLMEVMRWRPISPLGVAHRATQDDEYLGYRIAKGTTVISNIWAMMHDESVYPHPEEFDPERFMGEDKDSAMAVFGFGRRICPGIHEAMDSMFICAASIVAVFECLPPVDEKGNTVLPEIKYTTGLISHPVPFPCRFVARSPEAAQLITQANVFKS